MSRHETDFAVTSRPKPIDDVIRWLRDPSTEDEWCKYHLREEVDDKVRHCALGKLMQLGGCEGDFFDDRVIDFMYSVGLSNQAQHEIAETNNREGREAAAARMESYFP